MLKKILKKLDFSEKESLVYLSILILSQATPANIAKDININKTTVYDILKILLEKDLVSKYKKSSKTYFNALDPERLLGYLEREKEEKIKIIDRQKELVKQFLP